MGSVKPNNALRLEKLKKMNEERARVMALLRDLEKEYEKEHEPNPKPVERRT